MKTALQFRPRALVCAVGLLLLAGLAAVQSAERAALTSSDLPFYARFERGLIHTDGEWVAIAFYRPPDCVRSDFNLLDLFDVPAVFDCAPSEPYLTGFGIWPAGAPLIETPPFQLYLQLAPHQEMPVWFVRWAELASAITDDVLTIAELEALPSLLRGHATFYKETLHPFQVSQQTKTTIVASGWLEDGREFTYQATETHNTLHHVKIEFR